MHDGSAIGIATLNGDHADMQGASNGGTDDDRPTLAKRVADARDARDLSQADVAFKARSKGYALEPNEVSKIETGKTPKPGPEKVAGLAVALDVSADYLLGLIRDMRPLEPWDGVTERRRATPTRSLKAAARAAAREAEKGPGAGQ